MKKIISTALALVMLMSVATMPTSAYAASAPKATSISKVTAQSCAFKVTWKEVKKVTGYQVSYSTSKKFTKKTTKTVKVKKASSKSKTVKKLKAKKKYYVRVRTYKTSGKKTKYSKYSKAKSVTTKKKASTNNTTSTNTTSQTGATSDTATVKEIPCPVSIPDDKFKEQSTMAQNIVTNECRITNDMSDLKKLVIIGKWLSTKVSYNAKVAQQNGDKNITPKPTDIDLPYKGQTAWEVFTYHSAVCGGYAQAQMYLCRAAGIECYYVLGQNQGQGHGWNLVKIEGYWYGINCYGIYYAETAWTTESINALRGQYITLPDGSVVEKVEGVPSVRTGPALNGGCGGKQASTVPSDLFDSSQALWDSLQPKGTPEAKQLLVDESLNMYEEMHNWQIG